MHFQYQEWNDHFKKKGSNEGFDKLLDLFQQLLLISSGDASQALKWLTELDKEYKITDEMEDYSVGDFIKDLEEKNLIKYDKANNQIQITSKTERSLRKKSLEEIFRGLKQGSEGKHKTNHIGKALDRDPETRSWQYGDEVHNIDGVGTITNALKHHELDKFKLEEDDLQVHENEHYTSNATVLMIDLSHSMILYGEDRITPAKKVALALSELILNQYAKDSLDVIAFGNDAWSVEIKDLPYLKVGPYHTNTLAGLELARHKLQRRKFTNKQIFMITDGKPSAIFEKGRLYKNSFGLDRKIVNRVLDEGVKCRRDKISITTFMIAQDPYLQNFVRELTQANNGRAYFATLDSLGGYIFEDYIRNRKKPVK